MSHHSNDNAASPPPSATPFPPPSPLLGDVFAEQPTADILTFQPVGVRPTPPVGSDSTLVSLDGAAPSSDGARAADPVLEQAPLTELRVDARRELQSHSEVSSGFSNPMHAHKKPAQVSAPAGDHVQSRSDGFVCAFSNSCVAFAPCCRHSLFCWCACARARYSCKYPSRRFADLNR